MAELLRNCFGPWYIGFTKVYIILIQVIGRVVDGKMRPNHLSMHGNPGMRKTS
jgi:hypothetical protein